MTTVADETPSIRPTRRDPGPFRIGMALLLVLIILGLLALLLITPSRPAGNASAVSASFLGYTNNPGGTRLAVFSINNRSSFTVRREGYYEVQVLTNGAWKPQPTVHLSRALGPLIPPSQSEIWTINEPLVQGRWRVWFPYVEDHGRIREMKKAIRRELQDLGLRFKDSEPTYMGLTDEVEPPPAQ